MFGPVSSSTPRSRRQVAVVGHEGGAAGQRRFHHRMAAGLDQERIVVGHDRAAPGAGFGQLRRRLRDVQQRERVGAGGERVGAAPAPRCTRCANTARSRAAARSPASEMRRSRSDSSPVVKRAPLAMPWRSVSSGSARSVSTAAAGTSMHVAELRVVADFQAGDAVALRVVELQRREHPAAVVAQRAFGVQFGVEAGADGAAVLQPVRRGIGQRVAEQPREVRVARQRVARGGERRGQRTRPARPGAAVAAASPSRKAARSRGPPRFSDSRASARAMSGAARSAARSGRRGFGLASIQDQASCRAAIASGSVSGADSQAASRRAPAGVSVRCTAASSVCCAPPSRARCDFQAGARRRVHRQHAGAALRRRPGEPRQRARLGGAHVVQRHAPRRPPRRR